MPVAILRTQCLIGVTLALMTTVVAHAQQTATERNPTTTAAIQAFEAPSSVSTVELKKRTVDRKFVITSVLLMGLTIADMERTQHCLGQHTCVEMNPMLPRSRAGMYAVNIPMNAAAMYLGYRLKSAGRKSWLIAPSLMTAGHLVGAAWRM
ncbi:MAG: hypothetical protein ACXVZV_15215 [Terriglobales bacterium]